MKPIARTLLSRPFEGSQGRRRWAIALVAATALAHIGLADLLAERLALSESSGPGGASPARIEVAFVSELAPAVPPQVAPLRGTVASPAPAGTAISAPNAAPTPQPAASAPQAAQGASGPTTAQDLPPPGPSSGVATTPMPTPTPEVPAPPVAGAPPAEPGSATSSAGAASSAAAVAPGPELAAGAAAFEWPPSTRLSYTLVGDYRGPVHGSARVEWLRSGERYQVHLDVAVGPEFAPLMSRRMSSDGEITAQGLRPRRYEELTRIILGAPRRQSIDFGPERVISSRGGSFPSLSGIQDTASQFVQLAWMFTTQPQLLRAGQTVEVPLALPRRVDRWIYDVVESQPLSTPMGRIEAWYLRPRPQNQSASDLAVEIWFAPSLQYLPVRIRIRQDDATFVDLTLQRLPQQAAPAARAPAAGPSPGPSLPAAASGTPAL